MRTKRPARVRRSLTTESPARVHGLPELPAPLVGRRQELAAARQLLLDTTRLITLIGSPGIGKTRLAVAIADSLVGQFEHGVFFVDLSSIQDPILVASTICQAMGLRPSGGTPLLELLAAHLTDRRALLILDNFDHLLDAAQDVATLLATCGGLRILATSRAPLRLSLEREFPVPPLETPDLRDLPGPEHLSDWASVALFVQRAQTVNPDFGLTAHNARTVA